MKKLLSVAAKGVDVVRREGVISFLKRIYARVALFVFHYQHNRMFERRLAGAGPVFDDDIGKAFTLRVVRTRSELGRLFSEEFDATECPFLNDIGEGLARGAVIFMVFSGKGLAHSSWVSFDKGAALLDPIFQRIQYNGAGYIGPCYTASAHRGKGLYPYTLSRICKFLQEEGRDKALISTKVANHSSARGILKAGFSPVADVRYVKVLGFGFCSVRDI